MLTNTLQLQAIGKFDNKEVEPQLLDANAQITSVFKECRRLRQVIRRQDPVRLNDPVQDLLGTLPSKETCDILIDGYFRTFEVIYRIMHLPAFWEEYRQMWADPQSSSSRFMMKLILILALGTIFYPDRNNWLQLRKLSRVWIYAAEWWLVGPSEKSTVNLDGLQVGCLLLLARQTNDFPRMNWLSVGSLQHMAMAMGLHHNPEMFPTLSPRQAEIRARLSATISELVVMGALDESMPLSFALQDFDRIVPSNVNDKDIDQNDKTHCTPHSVHHFTDSSVQILLNRSLPARTEAVRFLNNNSRSDQSYRTALKISHELRAASRDIAAFFYSSQNQNEDQSQRDQSLRMTEFHFKFLDMYLRRYILLLHRPFMIQARRDPRFHMSRKVCLESCMIMTSYVSRLNLPDDQMDDLSRLAVAGRGSFKGALSLDLITAFGFELITQLEEETQSSSLVSPSVPLSSPSSVGDPLDQLAKANRAPLIRSLEHLRDQLLQIIALGIPSLKRYCLLAAILSQIQAMESGRPIKPAVYETLKESMEKCCSLLRANVTAPMVGQESTSTMTSGFVGLGPDPLADESDFMNTIVRISIPLSNYLQLFVPMY